MDDGLVFSVHRRTLGWRTEQNDQDINIFTSCARKRAGYYGLLRFALLFFTSRSNITTTSLSL